MNDRNVSSCKDKKVKPYLYVSVSTCVRCKAASVEKHKGGERRKRHYQTRSNICATPFLTQAPEWNSWEWLSVGVRSDQMSDFCRKTQQIMPQTPQSLLYLFYHAKDIRIQCHAIRDDYFTWIRQQSHFLKTLHHTCKISTTCIFLPDQVRGRTHCVPQVI